MRGTAVLLIFRLAFSALLVLGTVMVIKALGEENAARALLPEAERAGALFWLVAKAIGSAFVLAMAAFGLWAFGRRA